MRVLVSDALGEEGVEMFEKEDGIEVDVKVGLSPKELKDIIAGYDGLAIRSATKVTADLLDAATRLKVVGRAGIGLDNVDIPAATQNGIVVMNTPDGNVITTAEHAISLMLSLTRNIPQGTASMKAGRWEKKELQGRELFNKVVGVIGYGKIGSIVADRARGLRMQVIVYDPYVTPDLIEKAGFESVTLDQLYQRSDYISVHVPKLKDTVGLIDKSAFEKMKDGAMVINCARGGIVREADLLDALKSGKVAGAALDVFFTEPPGELPLLEIDNLICTPHLGAATREAQTNVAVSVAGQIIDYLKNGTVINAVNAPSVSGELLKKLNPFLNLADRMGCLQAQLSRWPLKGVSIEFAGDFQDLDLAPISMAVLKGLLTPIVKDDVNFVNARIMAKGRGITVKETTSSEAEDFLNLITIQTTSQESAQESTCTVAGTIYGKRDPRIVKINNFRLEMIPEGYLALIYNEDKPGTIGEIGNILGRHSVNIDRMQVGQEKEGKRNITFLCTDVSIPDPVIEELRAMSLIRSVTPLEL